MQSDEPKPIITRITSATTSTPRTFLTKREVLSVCFPELVFVVIQEWCLGWRIRNWFCGRKIQLFGCIENFEPLCCVQWVVGRYRHLLVQYQCGICSTAPVQYTDTRGGLLEILRELALTFSICSWSCAKSEVFVDTVFALFVFPFSPLPTAHSARPSYATLLVGRRG